MSVPIGGLSFKVDADLSPAQRSLQAFVQTVQQSAGQISQILSGIQAQPTILKADGTPFIRAAQQAEAAVEKLAATAKQVADRPTTLTIRANLNEADAGLEKLVAHAREIGNARLNLTVNASEAKTAEAALERMATALRSAKAGEQITLNVRAANVSEADAAILKMTADINAAKAAGARVAVNVQTNASQGGTSAGGGFLQGVVQQLTPGLSSSASVAAGVVAAQVIQRTAQAFVEATKAGIDYNAMLETASTQLRVFTGSAAGAERLLQDFRKNADITPFSTSEVVQAGSAFARLTDGNIQRTERLLRLAEQLAAVNPNREQGGGLEGATIAIQESQAGDFTSIQRRFNIPPSVVAQVKALGLSADETTARLVKLSGGSQELVDKLGDSFTGRLNTAQSALLNIAAAASKPLFDALTVGLGKFNDSITQGQPLYDKLAGFLERLEKLGGGGTQGNALAALSVLANPVGTLAAAAVAPSAPPPPPSPPLTRIEAGQQEDRTRARDEVDKANDALRSQKLVIDEIKKGLEQNAAEARKVTEEYEKQLRPLEEQGRKIDAQIRANQATGRTIAAQQREAQGPVDQRAQIAGTQVILDHEQAVLDIRHKRAELAEQIATAEVAAANRVAEAEIRGQERTLTALQQRTQAENQARQLALEGLQEEVRGRQEARQEALQGLRDIIQARQEERREALEALQEEIRGQQEARRAALDSLREQINARRSAVDDEKAALQEVAAAQEAAYQQGRRAAAEDHQNRADRFRSEIENLQQQSQAIDRQTKQKSAASKELAAFDEAERARQRAVSVSGAERSVLEARTGKERADALQRLNDVRAQAAADEKRDALQARIAKEQEQADTRKQAIADKIAAVEQKARDEDRRFQAETQANDRQHAAEVERQRIAQQVADHAEAAQRRAEDAQVKAAEKADRDATKAEQDQIRAAEKADREQTRAEQAQLQVAERAAQAADRADQARVRAAEKADREADRAAQAQILALQNKIAAERNALTDRQAALDDKNAAAALVRLRESAGLEQQILDNRQRALDIQNTGLAAQAAAAKVRNDDAAAALADVKAKNDADIAAIVALRTAALEPLKQEADLLKIAEDHARAMADAFERQAAAAQKTVDIIKGNVALGARQDLDVPSGHSVQNQPSGGLSSFVDGIVASLAGVVGKIGDLANNAIAAWSSIISSDTTAEEATKNWSIRSSTAAFRAWGVQSPSTVMIELAHQVAQGFIDGLEEKQQEIAESIEKPIIDVTDHYFPSALPKFRAFGDDAAMAVDDGWKADNLDQKIIADIEAILAEIEAKATSFREPGRLAGLQFEEGFCAAINGMKNCFTSQMQWMVNNARAFGTQVGAQFSGGFSTTANMGGPGGGPGNQPTYIEPIRGSCPAGYNLTYHNGRLACVKVDTGGQPTFGPGPGAQRPIARATGGDVWPWQDYIVGEHGPEMFRPRQAGAIIPASLTRSALTSSAAGAGGSREPRNVTVNVTVHGSNLDIHQLSAAIKHETVGAVIDALDLAERHAPNAVRGTLPGALGSPR